ncbi:hypothetical protein [Acetobacter indonesiensis]
MTQSGFFDVEERLSRLSGLGGQLEAFSFQSGSYSAAVKKFTHSAGET